MLHRCSSLTTPLLLIIALLLLVNACRDEEPAPAPDAGVDAGVNAATDMGEDALEDAAPDAQTDAEDAADDGADDGEDVPPFTAYRAADDWTMRGPGAPKVTFTQDQLYQNCAFLDGTEDDLDHHNLVVMYDGYLLMPWAHESKYGALSFFDITDPCAPIKVGEQDSDTMRETHSIGFMHHLGKRWAVTMGMERLNAGGLLFWDVSDVTAPRVVRNFNVPGFFYPDAYKRVVLSAFWQGRYVYTGGSLNGVHVIDALDPENPKLVNQYVFEPLMQVGQVQAVGNLLIVTTAEGRRAALLDISDPENPQPIPGGDFLTLDADGTPREAYFSNSAHGHLFFARKEGGGGLMIYDIRDPQKPTKVGDIKTEGSGGYVFVKDHYAFVGESSYAALYDISDYANITPIARFALPGDLDTITPIAHLAVLSVDDKAIPDQATAIAPWHTDPDTTPPTVTWAWPSDNAQNLPVTSQFGFMLNEMTEPMSAFEGSVRLYRADAPSPEAGRVPILVSTQEHILNVSPLQPLEPNTTYRLDLLANGITDHSGNRLAQTLSYTYSTGAR